MFSVGEKVVHPMHGAGVIADITRERMGGVWGEYYVFSMPMSGLTLKIPTASGALVGLRPLIDRETLRSLLHSLPAMELDNSTNWNRRYRENMSHIKSGDVHQVVGVIKSLLYRDLRRGLSTGEHKMLRSAKQIFLSELMLVEDVDYNEAELLLQSSLDTEQVEQTKA